MSGPLANLRVLEFTGLGPAPLAGQLLADLGAEVIAIDRRSADADAADINRRGKRSIALDLKQPEACAVARALIDRSDVLIEGFRPGVMERLGLGPAECHDRLIYGRMTGWGQDGPWAARAGHDLTYLAMTGALHAMGSADRPPPVPLNLVADYGAGSMFLLFGVLAALIERGVSGKGQVVDAAMADGVPAMMGLIHGMLAQGAWTRQREDNWLDGAAPFYRCYACSDGKFIAVGALEPQFYVELITLAGLPAALLERQNDRALWPERRALFAAHFATRRRDDWAAIFEGSDACVAPVLTFEEAAAHPVNRVRRRFVDTAGVIQAAPAPRFSRSAPPDPDTPGPAGGESRAILAALGYSAAEVDGLLASGALT